MKNILKITILLLLISSFANATTHIPLESLSVGNQEILFNYKMTISEVKNLFGDVETHRKGDAANFMAWVCYKIESDDDTAVLVLSSGEIGGGKDITGFELARPGLLPDLEIDCVTINLGKSFIFTNNGVSLGMTRNQVLKNLGSPTKDKGTILEYYFSEERFGRIVPIGEEMEYWIVSSLNIYFENDIVVRIQGFRGDQG